MTRVAALYDIHANLPALDAALADAEEADLVVVGGDFSHGPLPAETVDRLRGLGDRVQFIRGNADREVARPDAWQREPLGQERLAFLAGLPETVTIEIDGLGSVLFCHGSPRSSPHVFPDTGVLHGGDDVFQGHRFADAWRRRPCGASGRR